MRVMLELMCKCACVCLLGNYMRAMCMLRDLHSPPSEQALTYIRSVLHIAYGKVHLYLKIGMAISVHEGARTYNFHSQWKRVMHLEVTFTLWEFSTWRPKQLPNTTSQLNQYEGSSYMYTLANNIT